VYVGDWIGINRAKGQELRKNTYPIRPLFVTTNLGLTFRNAHPCPRR